MDVTNMPKRADLLRLISKRHSDLNFMPSNSFYWSPKKSTIYYEPQRLLTEHGEWALLHEISHALLGHTNYFNDVGLLLYEVAAWEHARNLSDEFDIKIDGEHVEDCLDTYRDWLYARSTCPICRLNALQVDTRTYKCLNCSTRWQVSASRFCRPYRMRTRHEKTSPGLHQATFQ